MADKKLIIALPCQNTVLAKMAFSLAQVTRTLDVEWDMIMRLGCDIVGSRIWLVKKAIEMGGTHILFVDDDMFFAGNKKNPIETLLSREKDIIGVEYNYRQLPLKSTAIPETLPSDKQPYKCKALGTGFMLINLDIFKKIEEPWFNFGRKPDGELAWGEDTYLCQKAIQAGFQVWCDPTVKVQHIGEFMF